MRVLSTACPRCSSPLEMPLRGTVQADTCPVCEARVITHAFPALLRPAAATPRRDTVALTDESTCFNHAAKRAVAVCEDCGRFICTLCDTAVPGAARHQCISCFEASLKREAGPDFSASRIRLDDVALTVAVFGTLIFYFAPVTIPVVCYLMLRHRRQPRSALPRSRWRLVVAGLLVLVQLSVIGSIVAMLAFM